jgi:hypothetical protein
MQQRYHTLQSTIVHFSWSSSVVFCHSPQKSHSHFTVGVALVRYTQFGTPRIEDRMNNLSMNQALGLWSELESAYYGKNRFGSDTAEIYTYRLMPYTPSAVVASLRLNQWQTEAYRTASQTLHNLLLHFQETHDRVRIEIDGKELGPWLKDAINTHRYHVRVVRDA